MKKLSEIIIRDPFILPCRENSTYYLYGTSHPANGYDGWGFHCWKSSDLENWDGPFRVFAPAEDFWGKRDFWAPEVHFYCGRYYLFGSCKADGACRASHIFQSNSPEGPFEPLTPEPITPAEWECLDATLYVEDGTPYTVFCHEWKQVEDGEMVLMQLTGDLKAPASPPVTLFKASEAPWTRSFVRDGKNANFITDGPFLFKHENRLLMLWSSKGPEGCGGYSMGYAESASGKVAGPWIHHEKLIHFVNGGHGMAFTGFDGKLYCTLHQPNTPPEHPAIFELKDF